MNSIRNLLSPFRLSVIVLFLIAAVLPISAQTTPFTYQGKLQELGAPANGTYDFKFKLFDMLTGGTQIGFSGPLTLTIPEVQVTNGTFSVQLNFGPTGFTGADRFLEILVRQHSADPNIPVYTTLSPRQPIAWTAYAIHSITADSATTATTATTANNALQLGGVAANQYVQTTDVRISSGTFLWQVVAGTSQQALINTGYLANNASRVTITLPASPSVGDIVRVSGSGAGGWRIAQNSGQTILGTNLDLIGQVWTGNTNLGSGLWQAVASSSDGNKLVAARYAVPHFSGQYFPGRIYTSADSGVSWAERDQRFWIAVASSADGTKLVAAESELGLFPGGIYTSTNSGESWTKRDSDRVWRALASSDDGAKLVAAVYGGRIYTSTNSGQTWTLQTSFDKDWHAVASSADGTKVVAVVRGGQIWTSTNSGVDWTFPREQQGLVVSSVFGRRDKTGCRGQWRPDLDLDRFRRDLDAAHQRR